MIYGPSTELISPQAEDITIAVTGATDTVFRLNDDPAWHRIRPLLNNLCRRHGDFVIELRKPKAGVF